MVRDGERGNGHRETEKGIKGIETEIEEKGGGTKEGGTIVLYI